MQRMVLLLGVLCLLLQCTLAQTSRDDLTSSASSSAFREVESVSTSKPEPAPEERTAPPGSTTPTSISASQTGVHATKKPLSALPAPTTGTSNTSRTLPLVIQPSSPLVHPFPRPSPTSSTSPGHPHLPASPPPVASHKHTQSVVAIVFEVLGGLVGAFLLFMLSRCLYSWKRTPGRDRIESLLSRHYIEREMQERETRDLEQRIWRTPSLRPPPPPYLPPAPAYETVAIDIPATDAPTTDAPTTDVPVADVPTAGVPATEAPA